MKKNIGWIAAVLALVLLIGGASLLYDRLGQEYQVENLAATEVTEEGQYAAPDFTVCDADGNEVSLSDFFGKPIVLNFWASWCGPCKSEMPDFDEVYSQQGAQIQFLMVNLTDGYQETMDTAKAFLDEAGYSFPVYFDTASEAAAAYGVSAIPATYFIDADGNLVTYAAGAISAELLQKGISMITE